MNWGRKGAFLMLAVVVLWTAMSVSACLLAVHSHGQPDCCRGMESGCGGASMRADASCCQTHPQNAAVATAPVYSPQHSQRLAFVTLDGGLRLAVLSGARQQNSFDTPPPKFPPGGAFALRI